MKENLNKEQSYWAIVKRQFKKNRVAVWSLRIIMLLIFIGLTADFIANDKPYYCKIEGETYFPVLKDAFVNIGIGNWDADFKNVNWKNLEYESVIWPIIPYHSKEFDRYNVQYKGPFDEQAKLQSWRWRHWMGTDQIGHDVLAGMIHGTRIAMLVGVVSMSIATFIGVVLGSFAGYFGDEKLKLSRIRLFLNAVFLFFAIFYAFGVRGDALSAATEASFISFIIQLGLSLVIFFAIMAIPYFLSIPLEKIAFLGKKVAIPIDILISRLIEIMISVPPLLLILSIVAIVEKPSIIIVMVVIGLTGWTGIARLTRGEFLKVRNLEYIEAAQSLGFSEFRTIFRHALPNALTSVMIAVAFGVAGAILTEAFLSFLGIGVDPETITWGKLLNLSREEPSAWWLATFPGFAIFITVTIFNLLGEGLTDALDPRLKQ